MRTKNNVTTQTMNPSKSDDFVSTRQAADMLGISLRSVQYWVENGKLDAWKTAGGHRRIARRSIDKLMIEQNSVITGRSSLSNPILLVEDEPELLEYYRLHIDSWALPINIETAQDGFEGLMKIGQLNPIAIITDLLMPNMDGFSMIKAIHKKLKNKHTKIIVVTALSRQEIDQRGYLPDDVIIFEKPVPLDHLKNSIRSCIKINAVISPAQEI
ncbi:MAG: response regulator [Gammaproteobacteria bacterium]|nr:response regulator [Gammaproteobacteria bacterium]